MDIIAYGRTFKDIKTRDAYAQMMKEKRVRAMARKAQKSPQENEDAKVRAHFAKESKHFGIK